MMARYFTGGEHSTEVTAVEYYRLVVAQARKRRDSFRVWQAEWWLWNRILKQKQQQYVHIRRWGV